MKKIGMLYILAVIISLCSSIVLHAEEVADSVCVVTVSKSEDGKNIVFSAGNGFIDESTNETYVFTNCKYISFTRDGDFSAKIAYSDKKDIKYHKLKKGYADANVSTYLSFSGTQSEIIISRKDGKYGSCKLDITGVGSRNVLIRPSDVLDSLDVTISYRYGSNDESKDSTIMQRLPVGTDIKYDIAESARKFSIDVRRPVFGKVSEVIYDKKDIHAVDDNYFSGKSFQGTPADTVQNITINSYTIDDKYQEVHNTLNISFNRVKLSGGLPKWVKDILIFVALFTILGLLVWFIFKMIRKGSRPKGKKSQHVPYKEKNVTKGEKVFLSEETGMLSWKVVLKTNNGKTKDLTPTSLEKDKSFKVNSTEYSGFTVCDSNNKRNYKSSSFPELHLERNEEDRIVLCSLDGTTSKNETLDTPRVSLKSDNEKVVRIVLGNQIEAVSVGNANVYCTSNNKYGWHVVVSEHDTEKTEIQDSSDIEMHLGSVQVNPEVTVREVSQADQADTARMSLLQNFFDQVMAAVEIDPKKILEADAGTVGNEIKDVVSRIVRERAMYKMIDSHFSDQYDSSLGQKKERTYDEVIKGLKKDAGHFTTLMNLLGETDLSRANAVITDNRSFIADVCKTLRCERADAQSSIAALKETESQYCNLKEYISNKLKFDNLYVPNDLIDEASRRVAEYNSLYSAKQAVDNTLSTLQSQFDKTLENLKEIKERYDNADNVHKNNRKFYLEKLEEVLGVLDSSLKKISSNVLSSADCAEMVKGIYTSANGFKGFYAYVNSEDWSRYDQLTDIRDAIASRLNGAIAYERSWVNGVARFHAYLRVPQLETHLAASGLSRRDFETAYNAMNVLYTAFFGYKSLVLPSLFVDVYNPDVHDYDELSVGNVISVVCSTYDSFRDSHSKLCDFNKIGYVMTDGTVVKPEVIF